MTGAERVRAAVAVAALAVSAAGCSEGDLLTAPSGNARVDGTWHLVQVSGGALTLTESPDAGRFAVTFSSDRALLKADCNTCAGDYQLDGDAITLSLQACTRAACSSSPLDTQVLQAVNGTHTVRLDASRLQLSSTRGELRFER